MMAYLYGWSAGIYLHYMMAYLYGWSAGICLHDMMAYLYGWPAGMHLYIVIAYFYGQNVDVCLHDMPANSKRMLTYSHEVMTSNDESMAKYTVMKNSCKPRWSTTISGHFIDCHQCNIIYQ